MSKNIKMSEYPDEPANRIWDDNWEESDIVCPQCKNVRMWQAGWYDGTPIDGGSCIGVKFICGNCNYYDSH